MASCSDIDNTLASIKASQDAKFAAMQAQIDKCCAVTDSNTQVLNGVLASITLIFSTISGVTRTLANVATSLGVLTVLGGRIDALEHGLDQANQGLSNVLGQIQALRGYVDSKFTNFYNLLSSEINKTLQAINDVRANLQAQIDALKVCCDPNNPNSPMNQCCADLGNKIDNSNNSNTAAINALTSAVNNLANTQGQNTNIVEQGLGDIAGKFSIFLGKFFEIAHLINTIFDLVDNLSKLFKLIFGDGTPKTYSGSVSLMDCSGNTVKGAYSGNTAGEAVLSGLAVIAQVQNQVYLNDCQQSNPFPGYFYVKDCNGNIRDSYAVSGNDLNTSLEIMYKALQSQINLSTNYCTDLSSTVGVWDCGSGAWRGSAFTSSATGMNGILDAIGNLAAQQNYYFQCINGSQNNGVMSITACGNTYRNPYSGYGVSSSVSGALQAQNNILGQVLDVICSKVAPTEVYTTGLVDINSCGVNDSFSYRRLDTPTTRATEAGLRGLANVVGQVLNKICEKLDIPLSGNISRNVCTSKTPSPSPITASFGGNGFLGLISAMNAYNTIDTQAYNIICNDIQATDCLPYELEPDSKYSERTLSTQLFIRLIDKRVVTDPTHFNKRTAYKCRLVIPNPRTGLTCADLAPITWTKGNEFGRINFDIKNINTHNYFSTKAEAESILAIVGALSTNAVTTVPARVTSGTNPLYPAPSVIGITVVPYYAIISTFSNGIRVSTEKLCCL